MHFLAADQAYADYMANGKSFLFAGSLRRINESARQLLLAHGYLLSADDQRHAIALLRHYDVWLTLWDELAEQMRPAPDDPFVFDNPVSFPARAKEALIELGDRRDG